MKQLVCLLIDLSNRGWSSAPDPDRSIKQFISSIVLAVKALIAMDPLMNRVVVVGYSETQCKYLFKHEGVQSDMQADVEAHEGYLPFERVYRLFEQSLKEFLQKPNNQQSTNASQCTLVSQALSMALCYINRLKSHWNGSSRILLLSIDNDSPSQYIPIMNGIFSAQKLGVPIDVCRMPSANRHDSIFLQQAAFITSGIYLDVNNIQELPQYLISCCLAEPNEVRKYLEMPECDREDLRAACFCHRQIIDLGHICSVCLSIFCTPKQQCPTCGTEFNKS